MSKLSNEVVAVDVSKMSKKAVIVRLVDELAVCKDKNLKQRITYTLNKCKENNAKDVAKEDLTDLLTEVLAVTEKAPLPKETSLKPLVKKSAVATPKEVDAIMDILNEEPVTEKKEVKKEVAKKEVVSKKALPVPQPTPNVASLFPKNLDIDGRNFVLTLEPKNILDILKLTDEGKDVILAALWTKQHLRMYEYDAHNIFGQKVKELKQDLDLLQPVHISPEGRVVYTVSLYTEVANHFINSDFEIEDGIRYSNGLEFSVYVSSDEEVIEEVPEVKKEVKKPIEAPITTPIKELVKESSKKLVPSVKAPQQAPQATKTPLKVVKKPQEHSVKKDNKKAKK